MLANRIAISIARIVAIILLGISISGCIKSMVQTDTPTEITDIQLSSFILGSWFSIDVKSNVSDSSADNQYQIVFEKGDRVKYIVFYPDGNTEGYTFKYFFISQDSIHVENLRITGEELWVLEKSGENLIVTRKYGSSSTRIVLERDN